MSLTPSDLTPGCKVRTKKSGKVYAVHTDPDGGVQFTRTYEPGADGKRVQGVDKTRVQATQWKVCPKYPEGRFYQASRDLKLSELELVE